MAIDYPPEIETLLKSARGNILDLGPGTGTHIRFLDPPVVRDVYAVEPSVDMHPKLRLRAAEQDLESKYHVLTCGAEPESLLPMLSKNGVLNQESGVTSFFDEIICLRVLCGVPHQAETVKGLYMLLKPGGRMIIFEHVVSPWRTCGSIVSRGFQSLYMLIGWKFWLAGCELTRDTVHVLKEAASGDGGWHKVDLMYAEEDSVIPCIIGSLVKKAS